MSSSSAKVHAENHKVLYLTDLEGNWPRLLDFYERSGGFVKHDDGHYYLKPDYTFVYGGDVSDRFLGTRKIIREFLRLKSIPATRFVLIAGNRDINKLRVQVELSAAALTQPPWHNNTLPEEIWKPEANAPVDAIRRLRFMLEKTMGSARAFDLTKQELIDELGRTDVSDQEVFAAYTSWLAPEGPWARLIGEMKLAHRIHNTLFIHGGVTKQNVGLVPGWEGKAKNINDWIVGLNSWFNEQYLLWVQTATSWQGRGVRPVDQLLQYPMPLPGARSKPTSVVTGRHVDLDNNPLAPDPEAIEFLVASGIRREMIGHTPIGDTTISIRTAHLETVFGDNSYSDSPHATWTQLSGPDLEITETFGSVRMPDGSWTPVRSQSTLGTPTVLGHKLEDGSRVIGTQPDGQWITTRMENFKIINSVVPACELFLELAQ